MPLVKSTILSGYINELNGPWLQCRELLNYQRVPYHFQSVQYREYNHHILVNTLYFLLINATSSTRTPFVQRFSKEFRQQKDDFSASTFAGGLDVQHGFARGFGRARIWCLGLPCVTRVVWWRSCWRMWGFNNAIFTIYLIMGMTGGWIIILFYPQYFWFIKPDICSLMISNGCNMEIW